MKKRTLSLLLAVACALSLSGCGGAPAPDAQTSAPAGSETPAAVDQTREIVFAASRDQCPGEQDAYYASMSLGVWEPLITKDESGKPAPALATEWEHNEDSTVWTFHLREGVTFSNGTPFNADSVLANFDRMKKGPFESSFYGMNIDTIYPGLVSYEKTDDYTVVLTLSEGQPLLDYTMVNYGSAIFEPSCFAEDGTFAGFPIGTGPYVVTENVLGQYCVIERNDSYWGTPGIAKTFRFKVIPDAETRYTALRAGEVQGLCDLGAISPSQAAEIDGDPAYNVSVGDSGITHFLNVNGGAFPFNDVRMREGLSLLLDRQTIIDSFYNGYGLAAGGFLNYTSAFYREQPVQHDPERGAERGGGRPGGGAAVPAARRGRQPLPLPGGGRVHPVPAGEHRGYSHQGQHPADGLGPLQGGDGGGQLQPVPQDPGPALRQPLLPVQGLYVHRGRHQHQLRPGLPQ